MSLSLPLISSALSFRTVLHLRSCFLFVAPSNHDRNRLSPSDSRNLLLKNFFGENALMWELWSLLAQGFPSSFLLLTNSPFDSATFFPDSRAFSTLHPLYPVTENLLASFIGFWNSQTGSNPRNYPEELDQSCRLMEILRTAQFLPYSLARYGEIFEKIRCKDISKVMLNVWLFLVEKQDSAIYQDNIKAVLRQNVESLGESYSRFFHR